MRVSILVQCCCQEEEAILKSVTEAEKTMENFREFVDRALFGLAAYCTDCTSSVHGCNLHEAFLKAHSLGCQAAFSSVLCPLLPPFKNFNLLGKRQGSEQRRLLGQL